MKSTRVRDLCDLLAVSLGLTLRAVDYVAADLQRAGMIGAMNDLARVEDAARLIVAIAGDLDILASHRVVARFWDLPLVEAQICVGAPGRLTFLTQPRDDESFATTRKAFGDDFGSAFTNLISDMVLFPDREPSPGSVTLSSWPGHTAASLGFGSPDGILYLNFGHPELADGALPHGFPIACPRRSVTLPAKIYDFLSVALEGAPRIERAEFYASQLPKGRKACPDC